MESKPPHIDDLRSSVRYNTNHIPIKLTGKDIDYDIPARLNNISSGGFQLLCSHYVAQQLSKPKYSQDGPMNIVAEIQDKDNAKTFVLNCKVVYIHQDQAPNDYCSD